ncbi:hypothetical protein KWV42_10410 [Clostridioides difficile]|uniref:hypothetical protein n=1 Tax=Clostridioides difficile TaxID=1496 RepID=UPI0010B7675D|nr:hypothetical protein [Clostridioides difficile]MBY1883498.1 hypothetical protein [Clostridioides difficile]MBZ0781383.1 hypothetical protein [Clostridioides difficile]MBZ0855027.1 hypothetical protein [Clostridioides difficile]MCG7701623.1 hypothetical protein [Clostridioides difficile]
MDENKKIQQQNELQALNIIKKNLNKGKFKSHKQVEQFLADKEIYLSQASISRLFNANSIKKNDDGYYEDFIKRDKKLVLSNFFSQHNCKIYKPMIYGHYISKEGEISDNGMYTLLIKVDNGYENYLYELIADFWGKSNLICIVGNNCIQILSPNLANIYKIYRVLASIKK